MQNIWSLVQLSLKLKGGCRLLKMHQQQEPQQLKPEKHMSEHVCIATPDVLKKCFHAALCQVPAACVHSSSTNCSWTEPVLFRCRWPSMYLLLASLDATTCSIQHIMLKHYCLETLYTKIASRLLLTICRHQKMPQLQKPWQRCGQK